MAEDKHRKLKGVDKIMSRKVMQRNYDNEGNLISKECTCCHEVKLVSEFHKHIRKIDGFHSECKECNKKYRQENKKSIKEYHKKHYQECLKDSKPKIKRVCAFCNSEFIGYSNSNYCSNKCKSAQRRKSGKDKITVKCIICGNDFITNKYRPAKTCSKSCSNIMWHSK